MNCCCARKDNPDFGELTGLRVDLYRPAMLLDDDVVADGEAEARAFAGGLRRKERIEHLFLHVRRDAGAVIANPDFHTIAKAFGNSSYGRLEVASICFRFALGRGIETI